MAQSEKAQVDINLTEEPAARISALPVETMQFPETLIIIAKRKSFILKFVGICAVLAIVVVLLLPKTYTASSKIMPPQQNQSMIATAVLSQLGPLGAVLGQSGGARTASDLYVAMLKSRTVADALIDRFSLMSVYKKKLRIDTVKKLTGRSDITTSKEGVISVSVDDREPQRAADIANAYVQELDKLTRTLAITEAGKRRVFFEREMKMAIEARTEAEMALKQTQEKTGIIQLSSQAEAELRSLIALRAQVAAQEVQVEAMRSFATEQNPQRVLAEKELAALQGQLTKLERGKENRSFGDVPIENVPTAGLEYVRKYRDVQYHEALFELLAKQYEAARIDEARDALIVQQLDKAVPPERKSGPLRTLIVASSAVLALLVAILIAFFMERMDRAQEDPQFSTKFQLFQFYLRGSHK